MLSLYEILKASKTGISTDMWTALAGKNWNGTDTGHEVKELTGIPPLSFRADGTPLLDYLISGNMSQSGTPTRTTPIQPQETGERTGNLFDYTRTDGVETKKYINQSGEKVSSNNYNISYPIEVLPNQGYIWSFNTSLNALHTAPTVAFYDSNDNYISVERHNSNVYWFNFTTPNNCKYIRASVYIGQNNTTSQLLVGSSSGDNKKSLPYEPYGYKIPVETSEDILINSLTSQEYNGLTLTKNPDGSVRVQGTATANVNFCLYNNSYALTANAYQIIENGVYYIGGGIEGNKEGKFILSARYDDAIGGAPSQMFRIPYGENIKIDNSNGEYKYLAVYIAVWNGQTVDFVCKPYLKAVSATNNIYLGEVQTTRRIRKLVLTGEENWSKSSTKDGAFYCLWTTLGGLPYYPFFYCDRCECVTNIGYYVYGKCFSDSALNLWLGSAGWTIADFKSYLSSEYANGTPVTVWYVLATPETGIVNEPLRKIGDYVDTLSYEQAGVQIPTNKGNTVIDVETELKPSQMYIKYQE